MSFTGAKRPFENKQGAAACHSSTKPFSFDYMYSCRVCQDMCSADDPNPCILEPKIRHPREIGVGRQLILSDYMKWRGDAKRDVRHRRNFDVKTHCLNRTESDNILYERTVAGEPMASLVLSCQLKVANFHVLRLSAPFTCACLRCFGQNMGTAITLRCISTHAHPQDIFKFNMIGKTNRKPFLFVFSLLNLQKKKNQKRQGIYYTFSDEKTPKPRLPKNQTTRIQSTTQISALNRRIKIPKRKRDKRHRYPKQNQEDRQENAHRSAVRFSLILLLLVIVKSRYIP